MNRISLRLLTNPLNGKGSCYSPSSSCSWFSLSPLALSGVLLNPRLLLTLALSLLVVLTLVVVWTRYSAFNARHTITVDEKQLHKDDLNYGIVIDAGSSSSKLQLFQWPPHDGNPTKLLNIEFLSDELGDPLVKKVEPGISTFTSTPVLAFQSLIPLLDFASSHIPTSKHSQTVLYILCTAGMRLLPQLQQNVMIDSLKEAVPQQYPFHLPKDGIQVIPGKMEGVFSWITINYLLGRFNMEHHHRSSPVVEEGGFHGANLTTYTIGTVGSLDMGGASLQVAFEIPYHSEVSTTDTVDINLGCGISDEPHKHRVYVSSNLGYGTNQARDRYRKLLVQSHLLESNHNHSQEVPHLSAIRDPCMPLGMQDNITVDHYSVRLQGLGDFDGCKRALYPLLVGQNTTESTWERREVETRAPCDSSNGDCQPITGFQRPPTNLKYKSMEFYGTSEFWYTMRDVLRMGGTYKATEFEREAREFCHIEWRVLQGRFTKNLYTYADHYRLQSQCMKSAWLSLILHEGLGFPEETTSLQSAASINGRSVQWPLGALLYYTRYLPLREVQIQQQRTPPLSNWDITRIQISSITESPFALPLLVVIIVIIILLVSRHRRPGGRLLSSPINRLSKSVSHGSLLRVHRRNSSLSNVASYMARNVSTNRLNGGLMV